MRLPFLAAAAALSFGAAAQAQTADVSTTGPWTGFYAGVHGGGLFDERLVTTNGSTTANALNVTNSARPQAVFLNRDNGLVGGQVGFNYQRGMLVGGVEVDGTLLDDKGRVSYASPFAYGAAPAGLVSNYEQKANYLSSARARVGVANDTLFVFGTAGYAMGEVTDRVSFYNGAGTMAFSGGKESTLGGFVVGGGAEYALLPHFNMFHMRGPTLRVEYLHYDLGDKLVNVGAVSGVGAGGYNTLFHNTDDVVRGAINVKF